MIANLQYVPRFDWEVEDNSYYCVDAKEGEWCKFEDAKEGSSNSIQQLKAEILLLIQRTKQCACADDMGSVKGLLEQIDAKLSAV